jgi:hypothetical protein|nr:MAG TPA: hypothetical protein [Caudoviricetes sp.]
MKEPNTGGIVGLSIVIILALLGINEAGGLEGAKQDIPAFLEILK